MPKRSTEAKNLDDDEWKTYENLTQRNKVSEEHSQQQGDEHSQQQARRAQPTAGEKSTANSRRERAYPTTGENQKTERPKPTAGNKTYE